MRMGRQQLRCGGRGPWTVVQEAHRLSSKQGLFSNAILAPEQSS